LCFNFRIVDGAGKTLGEGRDLRLLQQRLGARAQETWAAAVRLTWERRGLVAWTFDTLPERVSIRLAGGSAYCYPALVDDGTSVSLRGLSSQAEAEKATRAGLRRLLLLQWAGGMHALEASIAGSLAFAALAAHVATDAKVLREQIVLRALDETFGLGDPAGFPRSKQAYADRWERGRASLQPRVVELGVLAQEIGQAVTKVEAMIRNLAGKPGASRAALDDAREQLGALLAKGLFVSTPLEQLAKIPRYLRGIQVRLERLPNDPRRDADKAAQVVPMWRSYRERGSALLARGVPEEDLESFRWLLEELRVRLFAPELKTAVPVSSEKVAEVWKALCG
jgi:ATP-dependent helicase HrpA